MIKKFMKRIIKYLFYVTIILLFFLFAFNNNTEFNEQILGAIVAMFFITFAVALVMYLAVLPLVYFVFQKFNPKLLDKIDDFWFLVITLMICLFIGFNILND